MKVIDSKRRPKGQLNGFYDFSIKTPEVTEAGNKMIEIGRNLIDKLSITEEDLDNLRESAEYWLFLIFCETENRWLKRVHKHKTFTGEEKGLFLPIGEVEYINERFGKWFGYEPTVKDRTYRECLTEYGRELQLNYNKELLKVWQKKKKRAPILTKQKRTELEQKKWEETQSDRRAFLEVTSEKRTK